jgi:phage-related protein
MTREVPAAGEKPLFWVGSSKKDLLRFSGGCANAPWGGIRNCTVRRKHPDAKPWKGDGAGVLEVVEDHRGDTFRAVYTVRFEGAIYVLHTFRKKSKSGIKTPKADQDLITSRLKDAEQHYRERYGKDN